VKGTRRELSMPGGPFHMVLHDVSAERFTIPDAATAGVKDPVARADPPFDRPATANGRGISVRSPVVGDTVVCHSRVDP
jgi:hypothetical protein